MQILLIPPKLIESALFGLSIWGLSKKFKGVPLFKRPQLNWLMLFGMIGWLVYIFLDMIIYVISPMSFDATVSTGIYEGYSSLFPSLMIANILRDIGMFGALTLNWCYLIVAYNIRFGEKKTTKFIQKNPVAIVLILLVNAIFIYGDRIKVEISQETLTATVTATWTGLYGYFLMLIVLQFGISIVFLASAIISTKRKYGFDSTLNKKMKFILMGVTFQALGNFYWVLLGSLAPYFVSILSNTTYRVILFWLGHILWMIAAYSIFRASKIVIEPEE